MDVNVLYISYTSIKLIYKKTYKEAPLGPMDWKRNASSTEKEGKETKAEMVTGPFIDEKGKGKRKGWLATVCLDASQKLPALLSSAKSHVGHHEVNLHLKTGDPDCHILTHNVCHPDEISAKSNLLLMPLNLAHLQLGIPVT